VVNDRPLRSGADLKAIRHHPPQVVLIDLAHGFSNGREVALALRKAAATRAVPLVFVDGDAAKVATLRRLLPDAEYTAWRSIQGTVRRAVSCPPNAPLTPGAMAGYSGTPLPKKLGITPEMTVALVGAPEDFLRTLGPVDRVRFTRRAGPSVGLVIWFVRRRRDLEERIARMASAFADRGGLWIAWPKRASGVSSDVTQGDVRRLGLANGLVDYKIAAIDATWSGLKFARRTR
jgi:CheY-like chemotaxis protein